MASFYDSNTQSGGEPDGRGASGLIGRVLNKQPHGPNKIQADLLLVQNKRSHSPSPSPSPLSAETSSESILMILDSHHIEFASVLVTKDNSADSTAQDTPTAFMMGDVVLLKNINFENSFLDNEGSGSARMSLRANDLEVIEEWDMDRHGHFAFNESLLRTNCSGLEPHSMLTPPRLAIQCNPQKVEKVMRRLSALLLALFGEEHPSLLMRETSTPFSKATDCLILIFQKDAFDSAVPQKALVQTILKDSKLSEHIQRIYSGHCKEALFSHCDVQLSSALGHLRKAWRTLPAMKDLCLHVYPSYEKDGVYGQMKYKRWNVINPSTILHVFYYDGLWNVSILTTEDSATMGSKGSNKETK